MCKEWEESFPKFRDWALINGFRPELQIDRIDNDKGYSPENCRWVTCIKNQANRSTSIIFPDGRTTREVANALGMSAESIRNRLARGLTKQQAMTIPKVPNGIKRKRFNLSLWKDS